MIAPGSEVLPAVDRLFADWAAPGRPGGAVAVTWDGNVLHRRSYGLADVGTQTPFRTDHRFAIASLTKQFTAFAVLLLAEQGCLSLEDCLQERFPGCTQVQSPITIRQLLNNTSGLRDYITLGTFAGGRLMTEFNKEQSRALITAQTAVNFSPGTRYCYSNTNFVILSWIIENLTGKPLRQAMSELIFEPLAMKSTSVAEELRLLPENAATGYVGGGDVGFRPWRASIDVSGDGGIWSTLDDLVRWELNFSNPTVGTPGILGQLRERPILGDGRRSNYALGLSTGSIGAIEWEGHSGGFDGYRSFRMRLPALDLGVIVLANFTANVQRAAEEIASLFVPYTAPLETFAGRYRSAELASNYDFQVLDGQLTLSVSGPQGSLRDLPLVRRGEAAFEPSRASRMRWDLEFDTAFRFESVPEGSVVPRMSFGCEWASDIVCERECDGGGPNPSPAL